MVRTSRTSHNANPTASPVGTTEVATRASARIASLQSSPGIQMGSPAKSPGSKVTTGKRTPEKKTNKSGKAHTASDSPAHTKKDRKVVATSDKTVSQQETIDNSATTTEEESEYGSDGKKNDNDNDNSVVTTPVKKGNKRMHHGQSENKKGHKKSKPTTDDSDESYKDEEQKDVSRVLSEDDADSDGNTPVWTPVMAARRENRRTFEEFYPFLSDRSNSPEKGKAFDSSRKILAHTYNDFKAYMLGIKVDKQPPAIVHLAALSQIEIPVDGT
jgi:hypothetical protein